MEKSLAVTNQEVGITIYPEETIEMASLAAKALKRVVSLKPKPVIMNGEQYLEYEDLQLLGQFYGYTVKTGDAVPVEVDGVKGAKAHADLIDFKTGMFLGGAEAYCMRDEEHWNTRPKYEWQGEGKSRKKVKVGDEIVPWFQLASMAQTRAGAKAFRNRLAWVVVLAGYRPTPAEEIADMVTEYQAEAGHYCSVHKTAFFMRGIMTSYAHPIKDENGNDTGEWCHEHIEKPVEKPQEAQATLPSMSEEHKPKASPIEASALSNPSPIDLTWLKEQIDHLQWVDFGKWLKDNYKVRGKTASEMVMQLSKEQAIEIVKEIERRIKEVK